MLSISELQVNKQAKFRCMLRSPRGSEFEVQAFLWNELRRMGYVVRGEVSCYDCRARFDIVIYENDFKPGDRWPLRIIEVKKTRRSNCNTTASGAQVHGYYDRFGIPVDLVGGMKEAKRYLKLIPTKLPPPIENIEAEDQI